MTGDLASMSAVELVSRYRRKTLSPVEAVEAALERIDRCDGAVNAFRHLDPDSALASARESEARWRAGTPAGLVDGVPTTIKDALLTKGWPTRRGSRTGSADGPWDEDGAATARLRAHGAVLIGKTTTPEFGWKGVTDSPLTGVTRNPWNLERTPGGSSGGASAACALGMGALHVGTDGAGSIRIPAAFTGIYGLKPTFGRVPIYPMNMPGAIIHHGPMTRTVSDAALMLNVIAEPDPRDWTALPYDARDWRTGIEDGVRGLRIAYSRDFGYVDVDPEVAGLVEKAVDVFADLGAIVEEADPGFEDPREAFGAYYFLRFRPLVDAMDDEQRALMDPGLVRSVEEYRDRGVAESLAADAARLMLGRRMNLFHQTYDLLVSPQMPLTAFEAGAEAPAGRGMKNWMDWSPFTYPFNFTQAPAASAPCGITGEGLPAAMQIAGPRYREDLVLRASRAYESARSFVMPKPPEDG